MQEKIKFSSKLILWVECAITCIIPIVIWWAFTPTNILNSSSSYKLLESLGILGVFFLFFTGVPIGIWGIIKAKRSPVLRKPILVFSIINLVWGSLEILLLALLLCGVVFLGLAN